MFWPDVIALKEFYNSPLGRITSRAVGDCIKTLWPEVKDEHILGIGFTTPYLLSYISTNRHVFACMPAGQGVIHWPLQSPNLSLLADESELPFPDNSMQHVLIVHALENSEHTRQMIAEIWRVLAPGGRMLAVVPNRRGIWARSPQSPFAHGQPFTHWQLRQLITKHSFTPIGISSALFFPPSTQKFILRSARLIDRIGRGFFGKFGGVILMEAEKQIYAPTLQKVRKQEKVNYVPLAAQPI